MDNLKISRRVVYAGMAALLAVVGLAARFLARTGSDLTARSRAVASVPTFHYPILPSTFWISPHELLTFRRDKSRTRPYPITSPYYSRTRMKTEDVRRWTPDPATPQLQAVVINISNGEMHRLENLTAALDIPYSEDSAPELSPDCKRLLLCQLRGSMPSYIVCDLDGSHMETWDVGTSQGPFHPNWLPDSKHWIEYSQNSPVLPTNIIQHSVDSENSSVVLRKDCPPGNSIGVDKLGRPLVFEIMGLSGRALSGCDYVIHPVTTSTSQPSSQDVHLHLIASANINWATQSRREMIWRADEVAQIKLSPQKDRVAYMVYTGGGPAFAALPAIVRKLMNAQRKFDSIRCALWVSGIDGKNPREIGTVDAVNEAHLPTEVQWLPDGKHISYLFDDTLWIVPVN